MASIITSDKDEKIAQGARAVINRWIRVRKGMSLCIVTSPLHLKECEYLKEEASKAASQALSGSFAVSPEKAKEIVLAHSQLTENEIRHFSIETDKENGVAVYEIEFEADTYEYSYAVNAATGAILQAHREAEDH